tara:strand:- start:459 stop:1292 length:834 start_codon:yes stop_codon:yes gene_type:complete
MATWTPSRVPAGLTPQDYTGQVDSLLDFIPPNITFMPRSISPLIKNPSFRLDPSFLGNTSGSNTGPLSGTSLDPTQTFSGPDQSISPWDTTTTLTPWGDPVELGTNTWDFMGNRYYDHDQYSRALNAYNNSGTLPDTRPLQTMGAGTWDNPDTDVNEQSEASMLAGQALLAEQLAYQARKEEEERLKALEEQYNKPLPPDFATILSSAEGNIVTDKDKWGKAHWDAYGRAEGRTFTDDFGDYVDQYPDLLESYNKYVEDPYHDQRGFFNIRFLTPGE